MKIIDARRLRVRTDGLKNAKLRHVDGDGP
jgi:hypothetical protein